MQCDFYAFSKGSCGTILLRLIRLDTAVISESTEIVIHLITYDFGFHSNLWSYKTHCNKHSQDPSGNRIMFQTHMCEWSQWKAMLSHLTCNSVRSETHPKSLQGLLMAQAFLGLLCFTDALCLLLLCSQSYHANYKKTSKTYSFI